MLWYEYRQNNSGGHFNGPRYIYIFAEDSKQADEYAENTDEIYFNGCSRGIDCDCCGDRWSKAWTGEGRTNSEMLDHVEHFGDAKEDYKLYQNVDGEVVETNLKNHKILADTILHTFEILGIDKQWLSPYDDWREEQGLYRLFTGELEE